MVRAEEGEGRSTKMTGGSVFLFARGPLSNGRCEYATGPAALAAAVCGVCTNPSFVCVCVGFGGFCVSFLLLQVLAIFGRKAAVVGAVLKRGNSRASGLDFLSAKRERTRLSYQKAPRPETL